MLTKITTLILLTTLVVGGVSGQIVPQRERVPPADFKSDGCSLFPDGNYRDCCEAHDLDYYFGGTREERRESDRRLRQCVRSKGKFGNKLIAPIIWIGVRIGGHPIFPTPFRWGFGVKKKNSAVSVKKTPAN